MNNQELTAYMGGAVERLVKNALKATATNPYAAKFFIQSGKSLKKAKERRDRNEEQGRHIPVFLISSITNSCNLFCKGCYARANGSCSEQAGKEPMEAVVWQRIFDEAVSLGISFNLLAGGEPLVRRDVIEMAAKQKEMIFPVFTNGTMINEAYVQLFRKNRNLIPIISMEGEAEATDQRRGSGVYEQVLAAMRRLKQAKLFYGVSLTVTKDNLAEVTNGDYIGNLYEAGCRLVFFIEYVPVDGSTAELAPGAADREQLEAGQSTLREQYADMLFLSFPGDEKYMGGCLAAGRGFFHINADGEAEACPFSPYSDRNLRDYTLTQVLESPLFKKLQEEELVGGEHDGGCALFQKEEIVKSFI